jgi:hypothetical protein
VNKIHDWIVSLSKHMFYIAEKCLFKKVYKVQVWELKWVLHDRIWLWWKQLWCTSWNSKEIENKQIGAPKMPSAVFRGSTEFEDFRCHRSVTVSHSVTLGHIYFLFQLAYFLLFLYFCVILTHWCTVWDILGVSHLCHMSHMSHISLPSLNSHQKCH